MVEFWSIPPELSREQLGLPDSDIDAESESIQQERSMTMDVEDTAGGS